MGGNIEGFMSIEQELEFMDKDRFEDPLKKKMREKEECFLEGGYMLTLNCKFPGVPNRYGIQPGYMWDGVDRGSAFEKRFLQKMNEAKGDAN
jgi:Pre-mRNA-splicing factor of RES complex